MNTQLFMKEGIAPPLTTTGLSVAECLPSSWDVAQGNYKGRAVQHCQLQALFTMPRAQHLLSVAPVGQGIELGAWLWQDCLDENKAWRAQSWKCLELARQLFPAYSSGVAITSWQYNLLQCPRDFSLPLCHTLCASATQVKIATQVIH